MSYGAEIYNENGALVFDGFGAMYPKATGTTINNIGGPVKCIVNNQSAALSVRIWVAAQYHNFYFNLATEVDHVVATSLFQVEQNLYCNNIMDAVKDLAFVSIPPEGILHMTMVNYDLPDLPASQHGAAMLIACGRYASPLEYRIFSTDIPTATDQYGMLLYNASGTLTFDSRPKTLGIEFFEISTSQVQNVLLNNATIDLPLAKSNPNAFVSSSDWTCATGNNFSCGSFVKITQPNDTTIRLSRQRYGPNTGDNSVNFADYHPMSLLVMRGD